MKLGIVGLTAVLVSIMLIAPALGVGVPIFGGADGVSTNGYGSGGYIDSYSNPSGSVYSITKGLEAHVTIPANKQGNAFARFSGTNTRTTTQTLNGNTYLLSAGYTGASVNAGARKTSNTGKVTSDAVISAYAAVDNSNLPYPQSSMRKNYLEGWAKLVADTTSSTTGNSYAVATGSTSYTVREIAPSSPTPVKEVAGTAAGIADVESVITDSSSKISGTTDGTAKIYTTSNANDWMSFSHSYLSTDLNSKRGKNAGVATINGLANGEAYSYAVDGSSPAGTASTFDTANAKTRVLNNIFSQANSYNKKDVAAASTTITSKAWHNTDTNLNYERAYNQLKSSATVTREDQSSQNLLTRVLATNGVGTAALPGITTGTFYAKAQDNQDPANVYAFETADLRDVETRAALRTASTVSATKDFNLNAVQNKGNKKVEIHDLNTAQGALTGSLFDTVFVDQEIRNPRAEARSAPGTTSASVKFVALVPPSPGSNNIDVDLFVDGFNGAALPQTHTFQTAVHSAPGGSNPVETFNGGMVGDDYVSDAWDFVN